MQTRTALVLIIAAIATTSGRAQSPNAPVVVQAVGQALPAMTQQSIPAAQSIAPDGAVLKALQELKASNDELLKKQAEELQLLDDIAARAEQLKIYTKRG